MSTEPNYSNGVGISYGGTGYRPNMIRMYPTPDGRRCHVKVTFSSYVGVAPGATHTHVYLDPAQNPVWDPADGYWHAYTDDPERPETVSARLTDQTRALRWAARTVERLFPTTAWEHRWPGYLYDVDPLNKPDEDNQWNPAKVPPDPTEDAQVAWCPHCDAPLCEHTADNARECAAHVPDDASQVQTREVLRQRAAMEAPAEVTVLVDGGYKYGTVGDDVLVVADLRPDHAIAIASGTVTCVITERGGAMAHLCDVAREVGSVTVLRVPDATDRYQVGVCVSVNPSERTVKVQR